MSSRVRVRNERGTMLPLAIVSALILFAVLAFTIDQGVAYAVKARQENALDVARSACMDASFALAATHAQDPAEMVAGLVVRTLREEEFAGRVTVWFYEEMAGVLPSSERMWVIGIQLEEDAATVFARGYGITSLPVASYQVIVAVPYASEQVWRPPERTCGRYETEQGSQRIAFYALESLSEYPDQMAEALRAASLQGRD